MSSPPLLSCLRHPLAGALSERWRQQPSHALHLAGTCTSSAGILLMSVTLLACSVQAISLFGLNSPNFPVGILSARLSLPFFLAFPPPFPSVCLFCCQVTPCSHLVRAGFTSPRTAQLTFRLHLRVVHLHVADASRLPRMLRRDQLAVLLHLYVCFIEHSSH